MELDLRRYALKGAEYQLKQIRDEERFIFRTFPELRFQNKPQQKKANKAAVPIEKVKPKRRVSRAVRKATSERMKKYWANWRKENG